MTTAAVVVMTAFALSACDGGPRPPEHTFAPEGTTIVFGFTDASVPPEHHRSFVLTIVDGVGTVVVNAYEEQITSAEEEVDPAAVDAFLDAYNTGELAGVFGAENDVEGCAGGTAVGASLDDGDEQVEVDIDRCGGENEEQAQALIDAVAPLLEPFDIETLTEGRYGGA